MNNSKNIKHYSVEDLINYHQGKLTSSEMHELEKAALEDPFLQDALDGYGFSKEYENELAEIRQRLTNWDTKAIKRESGFFEVYRYPLSMAASLVILVFAGYFMIKKYYETNKNNKMLLARNEPVMVQNNPSETKGVSTEITPQVKKEDEKQIENNITEDKPTENNISEQKDISVTKSTETKKSEEKNKTISIYDTEEPVAIVKFEEPKVIQSNNDLKSDDATKESTQTAVAMSSAPVELKNMSADIEISGDLRNFQTFVLKNKKEIKDENGNSVKGKVSLNFDTDKNGNPTHIKISKSLNTDCDEEAIRLLKKGPKWAIVNAKSQTVDVEF